MTDCCTPPLITNTVAERTPNPVWHGLDDCGNKAAKAVGVDATAYVFGLPVKRTANLNEFEPVTDAADVANAVGITTSTTTAAAPDDLRIEVVRTGWFAWADVAAALGVDPTDPAIRLQVEADLEKLNIYLEA